MSSDQFVGLVRPGHVTGLGRSSHAEIIEPGRPRDLGWPSHPVD
jgi:hypothetical protein